MNLVWCDGHWCNSYQYVYWLIFFFDICYFGRQMLLEFFPNVVKNILVSLFLSAREVFVCCFFLLVVYRITRVLVVLSSLQKNTEKTGLRSNSNPISRLIWITVWIPKKKKKIQIFPFAHYYMSWRRFVLSGCSCSSFCYFFSISVSFVGFFRKDFEKYINLNCGCLPFGNHWPLRNSHDHFETAT